MNVKLACQFRHHGGDVPLLFHAVGGHVHIYDAANHGGAPFLQHFADVFVAQNLVALMVQHAALVVGNIVVFQHLFTHIKVAPFHFALGVFNLARQNVGFNRHARFGRKAIEDGGGAVKRKQAQ